MRAALCDVCCLALSVGPCLLLFRFMCVVCRLLFVLCCVLFGVCCVLFWCVLVVIESLVFVV